MDDLTDWQLHGVIYRKDQDPHNQQAMKELWAPDVCQGVDGRYYLYYCCAFVPEIGIAVCDEPAGKYEFYDYVRDENGEIWHSDLPFDPGILYEDPEHIWLYSGFGTEPIQMPEGISVEMLKTMEQFQNLPDEVLEGMLAQIELMRSPSEHCSCLRLGPDMKTVIAATPVAPVKKNAAGTSFEEHPFFEASSIRKIGNMYYLVYSSFQGNELCYATSRFADRDFTYRGVIISNADFGYKGNTKARAYHGNNHGGLVHVKDQWYIFYHRHTNKTMFSRQGCAEPVQILEDGSIPQVEITSCGLNNGPLPAENHYSAHICCNLMGPDGAFLIDNQNGMPENTPFITEEEREEGEKNQYISNLQENAVCGVKYIKFQGEDQVVLEIRGKGNIQVLLDDEEGTAIGEISVDDSCWTECRMEFPELSGTHAVYFKVVGDGSCIDVSGFQFLKEKL